MVSRVSHMRWALLQIRDADDPMREHEVECFRRFCPDVEAHDALAGPDGRLRSAEGFFVGGSGAYSVLHESPPVLRALACVEAVLESGRPTFASCWGFQAIGRVLGGQVVHDLTLAEVGGYAAFNTAAGRRDPVFGPHERFDVLLGHEDHLLTLPAGAERLAYTETGENTAFRLTGRPVYATQFHPELSPADLVLRLRRYPKYLDSTRGITPEQLAAELAPTPVAEGLIPRFLAHVAAVRQESA